MTPRDRLNQDVIAVLLTINETKTAPENIIYLGLDCDPTRFEMVKFILLEGELIENKSHQWKLTQKGIAVAKKIVAMRADADHGKDPEDETPTTVSATVPASAKSQNWKSQ